jgi:DNA (cytosine-5)-methyltransferase 1
MAEDGNGRGGLNLRALDLFCCAGGATKGLQRAGFHVTGVDIRPQPRYCGDSFIQADATRPPVDLQAFDFIWASPPCQAYSNAANAHDKSKYPDLIETVRELLAGSGKTYVIENVETAPLRGAFLLCGAMFGLRTYRHRIFESNLLFLAPGHPEHRNPLAKMGRPPKGDEFLNPIGHFSGVPLAREIFGLERANQYELAQAIPPAYSEWIARQFLATIGKEAAA